jgi:hypothetical protein
MSPQTSPESTPNNSGRLLDDSWTTLGRVQSPGTTYPLTSNRPPRERESTRSNALLTRYVTGAVTLPRPDPTRPDPYLGLRCIAWPQVVSDSTSPSSRVPSCNAERTER